MKQLKMYLLPENWASDNSIPEGYTISKYIDETDIDSWVECCSEGRLIDESRGLECFNNTIRDHKYVDVKRDLFFIDYNGKHIGTATGYVSQETMVGHIHMVGVKKEFRGNGLSRIILCAVIDHLWKQNVKYIALETDDFRIGAVKIYFRLGFLPVEYDLGMQDRWEKVLEEANIETAQMLYEDASLFHTIFRRSKAPVVKIGVFGAGRGQSMMNYCQKTGNAKLVAVCDGYEPALTAAKEQYGDGIAYFSDFETFLACDMDLVVLANYANEHAPYAIRCLDAGKHVLSEVLPVQTMKEAVDLIEAVERNGKIYAYAENYCYMPAPKKIAEYIKNGKLGAFEYAEGEYMHNCEPIWDDLTRCDPEHWRNTMSAFFYCTHSLGPLIHMSGLRPVKVTGFEAPFNARMRRMGAKAGPFAMEIVTLENGAFVKSLHGVGPSKDSVWYSVYGEKGRMESAREDVTELSNVQTCFANIQPDGEDYGGESIKLSTDDSLTQEAGTMGHGGSDYYVMYHIVQAIRGNKNAQIIDVFEAMDHFLPGMFAYYSAMNGNVPMAIPNLRLPEERTRWREDRRCTDTKNKDNQIMPSYTKGNVEIPTEVYEILSQRKNK